MITILIALAPVFILVALGYGLRRGGFTDAKFWPDIERVIFFVLFPALLVDKLAEAEFGDIDVWPMAAALTLTLLAISALMLVLKPVLKMDAPKFGSVFMGATRINTYVGIAAADMLYGDAGLVATAVAIAVWTPVVNLLSVMVLAGAMPIPGGGSRHWFVIGHVIKNPLILGTLAGILLNVTGLGLPGGIDKAAAALGASAVPLGLLAVGAGLEMSVLRTTTWPLIGACIFKLVAMPVVAIALCMLIGLGGLSAEIVILFAALPSATTAYILARQMAGDAPLMAGIITVSTLFAAATLPFTLAVIRWADLAVIAPGGL